MRIVEQTLEDVPVDSVQPHPESKREGHDATISESLDANGWYSYLVVQASTRYILVGSNRWRVAKSKGAATLPALLLDVDDEHARRIMLVDNRTNDLAGYHDALLKAALDRQLEEEGGFAGTGFTDDFYQALLRRSGDVGYAPAVSDEGVWIVIGEYHATVGKGVFDKWLSALRKSVNDGDDEALEREVAKRLGFKT